MPLKAASVVRSRAYRFRLTPAYPPAPGWQRSLGYLHYSGDITASREVPIAGDVPLGLKAEIGLFTATGVCIWPIELERWNFASMLTVPLIDNEVAATFSVGAGSLRQTQDTSDFFDLYFAPLIASYHVSELEHWSFTAYVYAPTADYDATRLAIPGLNVWTISPTVGYTRLFKQGAVELSMSGALDWYGENDNTNYQNGVTARPEALASPDGQAVRGGGGVRRPDRGRLRHAF